MKEFDQQLARQEILNSIAFGDGRCDREPMVDSLSEFAQTCFNISPESAVNIISQELKELVDTKVVELVPSEAGEQVYLPEFEARALHALIYSLQSARDQSPAVANTGLVVEAGVGTGRLFK